MLAVMLLISILPIDFFKLTTNAISSNDVKTKISSFISKYPAGSYNPKSNCYYFVKMITDSIFGHGLPSQNSNDSNDLNQYKFNHSSAGFKNFNCIGTVVIKDGTLTIKSLKNLLSKAQPGDVIQMGYTKWNKDESKRTRSRHVMMVYSASENGIILYHAGSKVYYGVGSGSDRLNGNTKKEISWAQLKYYFCNSADGLSLYRSKKVDLSTLHSHSYSEYHESSHPHKIYKKCSCGDWFYTGGTKKSASCNSCYPKPGASVISANDITVYNGESVTFKWTASSNTSHYNLKYILNNKYYNVETGIKKLEYTYKFTSAGTYYFYVDSVNANGYTQSNTIKITVLMHKWDYELLFTDDLGRVSTPQVGKSTNITWRFYDGLSGKRYSEIAKYSYEIDITLSDGNNQLRSYNLKNKDEITFSYTFDKNEMYDLYFGVNSDDPNLSISTLVVGFSSFLVTKSESLLTPKTPKVYNKTSTTITLEKISGCEYSKDGVKWQTSNKFTNLKPATEYSFYQRYAETKSTLTSAMSSKLTIRTNYECADPLRNHVYYDDCDPTCNICGASRKASHKYKNYVSRATTSKQGEMVESCSTCGQVKKTNTIHPAKTIKLFTTKYNFNGKTKKPTVMVKDSAGKKLISGVDYTVSYERGRKNVGTYKVTVTLKGNYSGKEVLNFKINPPKSSIKKLTTGKKSLKVAVGKQTKEVTGYEIQYSTSKKFKSAKKVTIKKAKTTTTIKKLKAKKTYYVRVRTYKTVKDKKYYSGWSTYKSKKTK